MISSRYLWTGTQLNGLRCHEKILAQATRPQQTHRLADPRLAIVCTAERLQSIQIQLPMMCIATLSMTTSVSRFPLAVEIGLPTTLRLIC